MTKIFCSGKLQKFIGEDLKVPPSDYAPQGMGDWNAHLFYVDKRKCLIFTNNLTRYSIFFADILKKDVKKIPELLRERLRIQMINDGVSMRNRPYILNALTDDLFYYRTNNDRKTTGAINDSVRNFKAHCFYKYQHLYQMDVVYENGLINQVPFSNPGISNERYSNPIELMDQLAARDRNH